MPRPTKDGAPAAAPNRRRLRDSRPEPQTARPRLLHVGRLPARLVRADADVRTQELEGRLRIPRSPALVPPGRLRCDRPLRRAQAGWQGYARGGRGEGPTRRAEGGARKGTFEELATRYVEEHAKKNNKSWQQADALVRRHVLPRMGQAQAPDITRSDVKALMARIEAPIVANQVLAAASAIFSWADQARRCSPTNPCRWSTQSDPRAASAFLSDGEVPKFWKAFDDAGSIASTALKFILLTGQRPGEVAHMRREHIDDGWWEMPGEPVPALGWPGTKNAQGHRVWLSAPARRLLPRRATSATTGFVFAGSRGRPVTARWGDARGVRQAQGRAGDAPRSAAHVLDDGRRLGFGRDALNRVTNHKEGGIASVYDRHGYAEENKRVMEATAAKIMALAEGREADNVVQLRS